MLTFLGEGYGMAAHAVRCKREVERTLARLGGDRSLQYVYYWDGSDDRYDDYNREPGSAWTTTTLRKLLTDLVEYRYNGYAKSADFGELKTLSDVSDLFSDYCDGGVSRLYTDDEAHTERLERTRVTLESTAAGFAAQCGHKVGTKGYVLAARKALAGVAYQRERWNDPEVRAEQWAACSYSGGGSSVYFDDLNFENSRYDSRLSGLQGVLDWLEQACPLLMRQMEMEPTDEEE